MDTVKKIIKKYFQYFYYFYSHLGSRIFISFTLSFLVGLMDGFGLAMFIPLLQMVDTGSHQQHAPNMGNMSFILDFFEMFNLPLTLVSVLLLILFFFSIKAVFKFFEGYFRAIYEQYFIRDIRNQNIAGLSNYSFNNFINADPGRIQNTFTGEVEKVKQSYRSYFLAAQYATFVVVYILMAVLSNPEFSIMVVIGGGLSGLLIQQIKKRTKALSLKITTDSHEFQGLLIQKVNFFKYLKSTGSINKYAEKLLKSNLKIFNSQKKLGILAATLSAIREPIVIFVVLISIFIEVNYFHQQIGVIIITLLLFYRALISLTGMQNFFNLFFSNSGSLQNMTEFNKELKAGKEKDGNTIFTKFQNKIEIKNISFNFQDHKILDDISTTIFKNETIAIVGESGSGKTTLINLITGLLDTSAGHIYIDDIDLKSIKKATFQNRIGYITQEPVIFNDTIFNNVSFWDEYNEENSKKFERALQQASIFDFVMNTPEKGNTLLGSNGINISGGQKQRISIARELYKEVDFLLMDEATSALDSETEKNIKDNIESLYGKYTIIIIAHRLSTIKNADRIILMNKGKIVDTGSFEQLISNPLFSKMVTLQGF